MKNILLILNATLTPPHVRDAAINIAKASSALLHTFFVFYRSDLAGPHYLFPNDLSLTENNLTGRSIKEEDEELIAAQVKVFKDECETAGVAYLIEPDTNVSNKDIIRLSAFADIVLADAHQDVHEHNVADLLSDAHCPVYLISKDAGTPENIVLAYDGSLSSIYAVKMYSYLFPGFRDLPTTLLYVHDGSHPELPQERNINMWLSQYYPRLEVEILQGKVADQLVEYTRPLPRVLTVMGSYNRNQLSRLFHTSHAKALIEEGRSSVFISHK